VHAGFPQTLKDILRKTPESSKETADEVSETGNDVPNTSISQIQTGDQALPNMDDFIIEESVPQDDIEISDNACLHGTHPPLEESQEVRKLLIYFILIYLFPLF